MNDYYMTMCDCESEEKEMDQALDQENSDGWMLYCFEEFFDPNFDQKPTAEEKPNRDDYDEF